MAALLTELQEFMQAQSAIPFRWGQSDCLLFCAEWVKQSTGTDPATCFRGTYATEEEAQELVRRQGGFVAATEAALAASGLSYRSLGRGQHEAGAIGIIADRETHQLRGGVSTGRGWIMKSPLGVIADQTGRLLVVRAWQCQRCPLS